MEFNGLTVRGREATLLTLDQFARHIGFSLETVRKWIADGKLTKKNGLADGRPARIDLRKFASYSMRNGVRGRRGGNHSR